MKIVINESIQLSKLVSEIKLSTDPIVEVQVEPSSLLYENPENLHYLETVARTNGKNWQIFNQEGSTVAPLPTEDSKKEEVTPMVASTEVSSNTQGISKTRFSIRPKKLIVFVGIIALLGLIGGGLFVYYYLPQGSVTLYVAEKDIERTATLNVDTALNSVNPSALTIPGRVIAVDRETSGEFTATGTKVVGEKATGTVEVYNFKTTSDLQLRVGTVLYASNGTDRLTFITTVGITIPPATITTGTQGVPTIVAGMNKVTIEAAEIGEKYNLVANTQFLIEGFNLDESYGKNTAALSGGTTREVTVVSADDQSQAESQITAKVEADLLKDIQAKINSNETFSADGVTYEINYITFNKEVGDEAASFTATIKAQGRAIIISNDDVKTLLAEDLRTNLPDGFEMSSNNQVVKIDDSSVVNGVLQVKATVTALIIPQLDLPQIKNNIIGKRIVATEDYLKSVENVTGFDINLKPKLPNQIATMPHLADRLTLEVQVANQ